MLEGCRFSAPSRRSNPTSCRTVRPHALPEHRPRSSNSSNIIMIMLMLKVMCDDDDGADEDDDMMMIMMICSPYIRTLTCMCIQIASMRLALLLQMFRCCLGGVAPQLIFHRSIFQPLGPGNMTNCMLTIHMTTLETYMNMHPNCKHEASLVSPLFPCRLFKFAPFCCRIREFSAVLHHIAEHQIVPTMSKQC